MQAIRALTGKSVPILNWHSGNACLILRLFGPEKFGGLGEVPAKACMLAKTTGKNVEELIDEVSILVNY
jgi:hypothetical protein